MALSLLIFSCSLSAHSSSFNFFVFIIVYFCVSVFPDLSVFKDEAWEGQNLNSWAQLTNFFSVLFCYILSTFPLSFS